MRETSVLVCTQFQTLKAPIPYDGTMLTSTITPTAMYEALNIVDLSLQHLTLHMSQFNNNHHHHKNNVLSDTLIH
eukprot:m.370108 g.370108  ORF g.370108 m.370108 type:complete len:75 (-) comp52210_c0_seq1:67-291(-)